MAKVIPLNRVLTDKDREMYQPQMERMQRYWPEMFSRKIQDSMVQFAFAYRAVLDLHNPDDDVSVLAAGSHEDIATECLKLEDFAVVGIDPVWNCDLHTFAQRTKHKFQYVVSASVLEHTTNDEEFVADCCDLLVPRGYGIFTMDFKNDWQPGQKVPYTSNRFYTERDLTERLYRVIREHDCDLVGEVDYSATDRFMWDGINYGFATFVFQKRRKNDRSKISN
jgi:SAM-dependent methyltransferase